MQRGWPRENLVRTKLVLTRLVGEMAARFEGVYPDGRGGWYFKVSLGREPLSGRRVQVTRRGFRTAAEAGRARRDMTGRRGRMAAGRPARRGDESVRAGLLAEARARDVRRARRAAGRLAGRSLTVTVDVRLPPATGRRTRPVTGARTRGSTCLRATRAMRDAASGRLRGAASRHPVAVASTAETSALPFETSAAQRCLNGLRPEQVAVRSRTLSALLLLRLRV